MKIRKAVKNDAVKIHNLICQLKPNMELSFDDFCIRYEAILSNKNTLCLVAEKDAVVGVISLTIEIESGLIGTRKSAKIDVLVIDEKHRDKGIGGQLLEEVIAKAKQNDCKIIQLHSNIRRDDAHRFYEKHNFRKGGYYFKLDL